MCARDPAPPHNIVASIAGGSTTRYNILGKDAATATWYQIQFSATVTGWVSATHVQTHGDLSGLTVTWNPTPQLSLLASTTANLNVRSGPGTSHNIVGTITGGSTTRYDILGKDAATAAWYQIQFSATVTGWVSATYVQTHGSLSGLTVTWNPTPQLSLLASTTANLNVRSGPGTSHNIVGTITGGSTTRYDILGKDAATAAWYQIQFSATVTGWVSATYVQTHGNLSGITVTWNPTPQLSLLASTTANLNVRSGPGTSHGVVGTITGGSTTRYDILGKDAATAAWYQIQFSATVTGWVSATYIQTHGSLSGLTVTWTPPQLSLKATTTANLNVRSGPGTSHGVVGTITGGSTTRYDILGKDAATATWYQIRFQQHRHRLGAQGLHPDPRQPLRAHRHLDPAPTEPQDHHHGQPQRALGARHLPQHCGHHHRRFHHPLRHPGQERRHGHLVADPIQCHRHRLGLRHLRPDPRRCQRRARALNQTRNNAAEDSSVPRRHPLPPYPQGSHHFRARPHPGYTCPSALQQFHIRRVRLHRCRNDRGGRDARRSEYLRPSPFYPEHGLGIHPVLIQVQACLRDEVVHGSMTTRLQPATARNHRRRHTLWPAVPDACCRYPRGYTSPGLVAPAPLPLRPPTTTVESIGELGTCQCGEYPCCQ